MTKKTIILAGSGHAHLEVIKSFSKKETLSHRFILISPNRDSFYSGLIPRFISGEIKETELSIPSAALAESKGFEFIQDSIQFIAEDKQKVHLASGKILSYDLLSVNIGGLQNKIPSTISNTSLYLRPLENFMNSWKEAEYQIDFQKRHQFIVVGGGAASVEVASALRTRINKISSSNEASASEVYLVTQGPRLCTNFTESISLFLRQDLLAIGVQIYFNENVDKISSNPLHLKNGVQLKFDRIFIVTPTQSAEVLPRSTDSQLKISSSVFAAGDCTKMFAYPELARSGVLAVHQGKHLTQNIRRFLNGESLKTFVPKKQYLNILLTGKKSARLVWGKITLQGWLPFQLKNWIDQKYMKSFDFNRT